MCVSDTRASSVHTIALIASSTILATLEASGRVVFRLAPGRAGGFHRGLTERHVGDQSERVHVHVAEVFALLPLLGVEPANLHHLVDHGDVEAVALRLLLDLLDVGGDGLLLLLELLDPLDDRLQLILRDPVDRAVVSDTGIPVVFLRHRGLLVVRLGSCLSCFANRSVLENAPGAAPRGDGGCVSGLSLECLGGRFGARRRDVARPFAGAALRHEGAQTPECRQRYRTAFLQSPDEFGLANGSLAEVRRSHASLGEELADFCEQLVGHSHSAAAAGSDAGRKSLGVTAPPVASWRRFRRSKEGDCLPCSSRITEAELDSIIPAKAAADRLRASRHSRSLE